MEKDVFEFVKNRTFRDLSGEEKREWSELFSTEEEFDQLKDVLIHTEQLRHESQHPNAKVKHALDALFYKQYPASSPSWSSSLIAVLIPREKRFYQQPLVRIAAVVALTFLLYPFFKGEISSADKTKFAEVSKEKSKEAEVPQTKESINPLLPSTATAEDRDETPVLLAERSVVLSSQEGALDLNSGTAVMFQHPDGVYTASGEAAFDRSVSAAEIPDLLDLLTATF